MTTVDIKLKQDFGPNDKVTVTAQARDGVSSNSFFIMPSHVQIMVLKKNFLTLQNIQLGTGRCICSIHSDKALIQLENSLQSPSRYDD
jgi:hypothetical protein